MTAPASAPRAGGALGGRHHLGLVAAAATLLATAPLSVIFELWTWLVHGVVAVVAVAAAAAAARALRLPSWLQPLAMAAGLLLAVTFQFRSGDELLLFPTTATFQHFGTLLGGVPDAIATQALPVTDHDGLLLLAMLGIGVVAILVDTIAVILRRPALAGLPMLAIYSVPVAVSQQSVPALTFAIGVVGYLWLVATDSLDRVRRFGRRFTGDGRGIEAWEPSPLAAAGRRLTVVGVVMAIALPLAVPGMTGGMIDRFGSGFLGGGDGSGSGGTPTSVNLFAHLDGLLNRDETVDLLEVTTDDPDPFYLRVGTADQISDRGFDHRAPRGSRAPVSLPLPVPPSGVTHHRHTAEVEVLGWDMNRLPIFAELIGITGADEWRYDNEQQVVFADETRASGLTYEFEFVRREYDPAALGRAELLPEDDPIQRRFGAVIDEPRVTELVDDLTSDADTPYDRVRAVHGHFTSDNGFRYSLETGSETTGSAIVDFLFEHRAGFCVQYAAAMAWMVRDAGLPSRVATGFTRGSERSDGTYLLTNHNLHAWTEVFFDGFGWVPFDPTPSSSVAGSAQRDWAPDPNVPDLPDTDQDSSGSDAEPLPPGDGPDDGLADLAPEPGGAVTGLSDTEPRSLTPWLIAGLIGLLALLAAPALSRVLLRRRRVPARLADQHPTASATPADSGGTTPAGDPAATARHRAHRAWDELLDTMVDYQVRVDPAESPRATAGRLVHECEFTGGDRTPVGEAVRLLGRAEERARYAPTPDAPVDLRGAVRTVRRGISTQAPRIVRLRAALLPTSTVQRWRAAAGQAASWAIGRRQRWSARMARLSPRRLLSSS
ncbi:transglutaminase domain-containing protein [Natronosporangium hydrolyticum]|uniref:Transglutaminase domain-containing protein n=1 Tax=Natronosporangium hydrolyticum TaxID=2811111 RepID=A0A895YLB6_9ACTN|nr:DUF3488 and transglutaminase-like domain-containing protein [Natronosporangium hydrolyticum]QSB16289.1 transglutaminase domain-containing protein [Natronosporangium hydrolyticum]